MGFDTSPVLLDALKKGEINALVAQDPQKMGYLGVKTLVEHLRGQKADAVVDTGVALVTPDNLTSPEIKKILHELEEAPLQLVHGHVFRTNVEVKQRA